jgi:tRNA pseudouridine55 synthase
MATGALVLGIGRGTRLLTYLVGLDKVYTGTIRLGLATSTDDAEGEPLAPAPAGLVAALTPGQVDAAVAGLTGAIDQVPSSVSAIKVAGKRAYARVRAGESVELAPRSVVVHRFDVLDRRVGAVPGVGAVLDLDVRVAVSSGTYVRALARDLGAALGVGGHLAALRRESVGPFDVGRATAIDPPPETLGLTPLGDAARQVFPVKVLSPAEVTELANGRPIVRRSGDGGTANPRPAAPGGPKAPGPGPSPTAGIGPDGALIALLAPQGPRWRPLAVFQPA